MRHRSIVVLFAATVCATASLAQQPTPPDTAHATVADTAHADSTAKRADAKSSDGSHSKVWWWVGGAAVMLGLMLLISDRPSSY